MSDIVEEIENARNTYKDKLVGLIAGSIKHAVETCKYPGGEVYAEDIIQYANKIESTVDIPKVHSCKEIELLEQLKKVMDIFGEFEPDENDIRITWTNETLIVLRDTKKILREYGYG
tara:strand:+ start:31613 stop:31963 length:351 start_codon:yes stop_codon:yes gene_type:complete